MYLLLYFWTRGKKLWHKLPASSFTPLPVGIRLLSAHRGFYRAVPEADWKRVNGAPHADVCPQPRVQCCAAGTASTPGGAASATAAGRGPSATFPSPSASILSVGGTDCAWQETVCATPATRESAVIKVIQKDKLCAANSKFLRFSSEEIDTFSWWNNWCFQLHRANNSLKAVIDTVCIN